MATDAAERELWDRIGSLFAEDDGSLPEVELGGMSAAGAGRIFAALLGGADPLDDRFTVWSDEEDRDILVNTVGDPTGLLAAGRVSSFHIVLTGVAFDRVPIPDLGVYVCGVDDDFSIYLDYRMGAGWDPRVLGAFVRLLDRLRALDQGCTLDASELYLGEIRANFASAVNAYLAGRPTR